MSVKSRKNPAQPTPETALKKVLVVDDLAIVRDPIAMALRASGFDAVCAATGREAIGVCRSEHPDAVLLDIHLPQMSGLDVLKSIRANPETAHTPVILLSSEESRDCIRRAAQLGVQGYLLKSQFSISDLLARLHTCLDAKTESTNQLAKNDAPTRTPINPADIPRLMTKQECMTRVEKALQMKTLSGAVAQVVSLAASPHGDASQLATLIARDAVLSARVLQVANSAAYASKRGAVTTVADAVRHVGCAAIRNIAAAVGIIDAMPAASADGFGLVRCWQHSLAVAQLCELLAANQKQLAGTAYLVGLCHDLGEIVIRTHFAAEYAQIIEMQQQSSKRRDEVEKIMLGVTHSDLVVTILRCMKLPDAVRRPIENFYAGSSRLSSQLTDPLAKILHLANEYAKGLLLASSPTSRVAPFGRPRCKEATGEPDPAAPVAAEFTSAIATMTLSLARMSPAEQEEMNKPLIPRSDARLWLARDPALSNFCPVTAALEAIAQIDLHDRLPEPKEMTDHRGLLVLASDATTAGFALADVDRARVNATDKQLPILRLIGSTGKSNGEDSAHCLATPVALSQLGDAVAAMAMSE